MKKKLPYILFAIALLVAGFVVFARRARNNDFISYTVDPQKQQLKLYWKDDKGAPIRTLGRLKEWLNVRGQHLVFAMNGGMYQENNTPLGLFIQEGKTITRLNTSAGSGNFYLQPNGVLCIMKNGKAAIIKTRDFAYSNQVIYATQSGPMLVTDGKINAIFKAGSANLNVRNGVGILPGGKLVFAMSKKEVNFYDFADYFRSMGCREALYLDGFVSRTYLPEKNWVQTDGDFGVIIGVTKRPTNP